MDNSVRPTIEKIKLQEQDNEARLREKRELNAVILSINRAIRDGLTDIEKLTKEHQALIEATDKLQGQLIVENVRQNALTVLVNDCRNELQELQKASVKGISSVWEKRSNLFHTVHFTSDKCDVRSLLIKPTCEIKTNIIPIQIQNIEQVVRDDTKLKAAMERKNKAIALRNYLLSEPEAGEEFVRTRNALQYSMEIMTTEKTNNNA